MRKKEDETQKKFLMLLVQHSGLTRPHILPFVFMIALMATRSQGLNLQLNST